MELYFEFVGWCQTKNPREFGMNIKKSLGKT